MRPRINIKPRGTSKPGNTVIIVKTTPCASVTMRSEQDFDTRYYTVKAKAEKQQIINSLVYGT